MTTKTFEIPFDTIDEIVCEELLESYKAILEDQENLHELREKSELPEWKQEDYENNIKNMDALITVLRYYTNQEQFAEMIEGLDI